MGIEKIGSSAVDYFKATPVVKINRAPIDIMTDIVKGVEYSARSAHAKRKGYDQLIVREVNEDRSYTKHILKEDPNGGTHVYSIPMKSPGKWMNKIRSLFRAGLKRNK